MNARFYVSFYVDLFPRARARASARTREEGKERTTRCTLPLPETQRTSPRHAAKNRGGIDRSYRKRRVSCHRRRPFLSLLPRRVRRTRARRISILLAVLSLAPLLEEKNPRQPRGRITRVSWNISRRAGSGCSIDFYFRFRRRRDRRAGIPASTPPPPPATPSRPADPPCGYRPSNPPAIDPIDPFLQPLSVREPRVRARAKKK